MYDLKSEFPRISHNEMVECRDKAISLHNSYTELLKLSRDKSKNNKGKIAKKHKPVKFPQVRVSKSLVPRDINNRRFKLNLRKRMLFIMDSMNTNLMMRRENMKNIRHDYLELPLLLYKYHRKILTDPMVSIRSVRIIRRRGDQYVAHFALRHKIHKENYGSKEIAVIGIDLGVKKDAVLAVLTKIGLCEQKTFCINPQLKQHIGKLNQRISQVQREIDTRKNARPPLGYDNLSHILIKNKNERGKLKDEADHQISSMISSYIVDLSATFDVYIALGDLKYLKDSVRNKVRGLRQVIHPFTYGRMTDFITYKLKKSGLDKQLTLMKEFHTSSYCWKCSERGTRPKQWLFKCLNKTCSWQGNADLNGAVNIAKQLISYRKLHKISRGTGLGMYIRKSRKSNTRKSKGKSQISLNEFFENDQPLKPGNPVSDDSYHIEEEQEEAFS